MSSRLAGSYDVLFDGHPVWSFSVEPRSRRGERLVRWPQAMRPWLDGTAHLELRSSTGGAEAERIDLGRVGFGSSQEPIRFVDKGGRPVMIDKWGIVQRPFESRGAAVTDAIAECSQLVIEVLRRECGIEAWIAFGTLLGAAREGRAIGHDSDVDLLYLSESSTPAEINLEGYRIKRALTRAGIKAVVKSGSFVTALFPGPDGVPLGVDVYACFYVDGLLHETATVRAPVPREAILPLGLMEFEGRPLPSPARPDVLLEASYGAGWRVPDPSFRHQPGPEITDRFDGWFGTTMTNRRAWESWWREHPDVAPISSLAQRLRAELPAPGPVLELGAGNGSDALALAREGYRVLAGDYARDPWKAARLQARAEDLRARFVAMNLYDLRDTLSFGAQVRRQKGRPPRGVLVRGLLDSLHPRAHDHVWRLVRMALGRGGLAYVEFDATDEASGRYLRGERPYGYAVTLDQVRAQVLAHGGRIRDVDEVPADAEHEGPAVRRWQLVAEWS